MATTIVTKKGSGAPAASDLVEGELAVDTTNGRLYTENSSAAVVELGSNPSGNITFGDNGKAIFGAGSDLQIYSDGSTGKVDGNVDVTGTVTADGLTVDGTATIDGASGIPLTLDADAGANTNLQFNEGGALRWYLRSVTSSNDLNFYGNSQNRLNIGSGGDISFYDTSGNAKLFWDASAESLGIGESSPDTPLHLTTSGTGFAVTIESTSGSATSGPDISIFKNSPSPADEDDLGRIYFHGENDGGTKIEYGMIRASVNDVTAGTEDSSLQFYTYVGGAQADRLGLEATATVFNESSKDVDFRVESDGNANALFVDASAGTVAVNTSTLTHNGNTAGSLIVNGGSTGSTSPIMMVIDGDGSVEGDSVLLECSFINDDGFSSARYVQFRDSGGTQGSISGTGDGTVAYNTSSDERLKQNIQDTDSKWDLVKSLQVRDYEWKKSGKQDTGFIAQELHDKWAQPVKVGGEDVINDPWSVDYGKLTPILTKALQEAMEKIETLEARIAALES